MPTVMNNHREKRLPLSYRIFSLVAVFLLSLMVAGTFFALAHTNKTVKADSSSFTFTAVGDYGEGTNTPAVLKNIGSSGANFNLALGDLNYNYPTVSAQQWIQYATNNLGSTAPPFEWVAGDHDYNNGKGDLADLEKYLPNQFSNISVSGTYGEEYSFDYPATNPLARFIMVSPIVLPGYNYTKGGADYNWVSNKIDAARNANIPWVIVGMAAGCIFINSVSNSTACPNGDLLNLLVSKKVDLILQAHQHHYEGGKQLAINGTTCKSIPTDGTYNANCVVTNSTNMTQGNGSVIVTTGTGGKSLVNIISNDPKTGYFRTWMGSNVKPSFGFSKFTLSATKISMNYVAVTGSFSDSLSITASTSTPPPSPSPTSSVTPSPSVTPSTTPGTTIAQDDFTRANQPLWGTASDGNKWGADANNLSSNFAIASNTGQVTGSGSSTTTYTGVLGASVANAEVVTSGSLSSFGGNTLGAVLRWTDNNDFYKAYITGTNLIISKKVGGTVTKIKSVSFTATTGTFYTIDFSVIGSTLTASAWPSSDPSKSVTVTTTDSSITTSGFCGVLVYLTNGVIADFSSFLATSH